MPKTKQHDEIRSIFKAMELGLRPRHEAQVSDWVRRFLTEVCGWRSKHLAPQRAQQPRGPVDWCFTGLRRAPISVEVKFWRRSLEPGMITKYVASDSYPLHFGILTNGADWQVWVGGDRCARLGVPAVQLIETAIPATGDWRNVESLLGFSRLREHFDRMLLSSPEIVRAFACNSEDVRSAALEAHRELFLGHPHQQGLARLLKRSASGIDGRLPPSCASWLVALRSDFANYAIRHGLAEHFGIRRERSAYRVASAVAAAFEFPGSDASVSPDDRWELVTGRAPLAVDDTL